MTMRVILCAAVILLSCNAPPADPAPSRSAQLPAASLEQLLAPIALYPDSLLAQMLMCATETGKLVELDKWLKANPALKGTALQDAAVKQGFEPSFVALVLFPQVVSTMVEQISSTALIGAAFTSDRGAVFAAIQKLRQQAKNVGTLKSTPQQEVATKTTSAGDEVIVIEPTNPQVVYVPQYNTQVVYTQPPATSTTVVIQEEDDDDAATAVAAGLIGFTAGVAIGAAMDNNYYYGPYGWHGGAYMYNDAWDDYYDAREDAREDWMDHREDLVEERSDVAQNRQEQRTERGENTQQQRTERTEARQQQQQRAERPTTTRATTQGATAQAATTQSATTERRTARSGSAQARGYGDSTAAAQSSSSDAFSGYSRGSSQRSASERGQRSRSSSRSGGGRRR
jgi:hypothetical protein